MWVLALVIVLPFLDLWSLLELGSAVGVGWTLMWCLGAVVVGGAIMRRGRGVMVARIQAEALRPGELGLSSRGPRALLTDSFVVVAGALIAFPGLVSDVVGLLLAIPIVRRLVSSVALRKRTTRSASSRPRAPRDVEVIEPEQLPPSSTRRTPVVIDVE